MYVHVCFLLGCDWLLNVTGEFELNTVLRSEGETSRLNTKHVVSEDMF